ncbi:MAG: protocatechuate 3,4-dioxygenase subunit alpha [Lautropia sp.]
MKATAKRIKPALRQTPSQTVGPYFAYGLAPTQYGYGTGGSLPSLFDERIADERTPGEAIEFVGQVFDGAGKPIPDALIEVLQADAQGRFATDRAAARASGFRGFGRVGTGTDRLNRFRFFTVKPGATADGHAPHLNVIVLMRGLLLHAFTRAYFEGEPANATDPVLLSVPARRRPTLIARRDGSADGRTVYRFDIRMQGDDETVFFDV